MTLTDLEHKKIYLLGYGKEGKATEAFLKKHVPSATIGIGDAALNPRYLDEQKNYDIAIRSPGVSKKVITIPYTTATNLFFSLVKGKTIGVTGTKGKSTTTSLIFHILKSAGKDVLLAGNIGIPMLSALESSNNTETIYVLELSSYMLDDIEYSPDIAVAVSLYPDHLDYHGSFEEYQAAKKRILQYTTEQNLFVYNPSFTELNEWAKSSPAKSIPADLNFAIDITKTNLKGTHNKENMQVAAAVAMQVGIDIPTILKALETFEPLPHRLQNIGMYEGITFYDDAISTTPESTIKALEALPETKTIFLGGLDRGYDFTQLVAKIISMGISSIVFFPDTGPAIHAMLKAQGYTGNVLETRSMDEAVTFAFDNTPAGTVCLLSTASPSYSLWKNFEEKGEKFQERVQQHAQEIASQKGTSQTTT